MVQNLKKVLKSKISKKFSFLRHEVPFKANNNREAIVVCAIHVVKRPSKRSVLVYNILHKLSNKNSYLSSSQFQSNLSGYLWFLKHQFLQSRSKPHYPIWHTSSCYNNRGIDSLCIKSTSAVG